MEESLIQIRAEIAEMQNEHLKQGVNQIKFPATSPQNKAKQERTKHRD